MKRHFLLSTLLLILAIAVAAVAYTQSARQRTAASLAGVWKGDFPNTQVPGAELSLKMQSGKPAGAVIFYQVTQGAAGPEVKEKVEAPLLDPVFDGETLSFQVKRDDGSFYRGRVRFVAEHEAVLLSGDQTSEDAPAITLRRAQ